MDSPRQRPDDPEKPDHSIQVNGFQLHRLRGGFLAFVHGRTTGARNEEKAPMNLMFVPEKEMQTLRCMKCGTLIKVHPPGRIARCCGQAMIVLEGRKQVGRKQEQETEEESVDAHDVLKLLREGSGMPPATGRTPIDEEA